MKTDMSWTDASKLSKCPVCKTTPMWLPEKAPYFEEENWKGEWNIFLICENHYLESRNATKTSVVFNSDRSVILDDVYRETMRKWNEFCKSLEGIV